MNAAALPMVPMEPRSERVLVANREWREAAAAAFNEIGRGAMAKCARETKVSQALINKLLKGDIATSVAVGPISDWLAAQGVKMPLPKAVSFSEADLELLDEARQLQPDEFDKLLWLARRLRSKK